MTVEKHRPNASCRALDPGIHAFAGGHLAPVGVTANLSPRVWEHREGLVDGFTRRYGLKLLVYYERFEDIRDAIQREKTIKHWPRAWKVRLIHGMNPEWGDLYETLNR